MRQVGILAAAGLIALEQMPARLHEDHANARYLAANIPGARYLELPGEDHVYFAGHAEALLDEIEEFVTGSRGAHDADRSWPR